MRRCVLPLSRVCIVCGRPFPEGQGVVITKGSFVLEFHSNKCMAKFFKRLLQDAEDISCIESALKSLLKEYSELREAKVKAKRL